MFCFFNLKSGCQNDTLCDVSPASHSDLNPFQNQGQEPFPPCRVLNFSCWDISLTSFVWICVSFENNFNKALIHKLFEEEFVERVLMNKSPSYMFCILLLWENSQAVLAATGINGLMSSLSDILERTWAGLQNANHKLTFDNYWRPSLCTLLAVSQKIAITDWSHLDI